MLADPFYRRSGDVAGAQAVRFKIRPMQSLWRPREHSRLKGRKLEEIDPVKPLALHRCRKQSKSTSVVARQRSWFAFQALMQLRVLERVLKSLSLAKELMALWRHLALICR